MSAPGGWNANIHYYPLLLNAVPAGARRVLDAGCGDGILCGQLANAGINHVVGLDSNADVLARAQTRHFNPAIQWVNRDLFDYYPAEDDLFDAVLSAATLHHMDASAGLARFAELVRPGGVVAVLGLAANDWWDLPYAAVAHCARSAFGLKRGLWEHSAPMVWPPPTTWNEMKQIATRILPGAGYKRHLLGRYSLVWTKPS